MRNQLMRPQWKREAGQTLIIAILVLGVLLILGVAFAGIINRNIVQAGRQGQRTVAGDLAEAGVRYGHYQLLYSGLGADWRPSATPPTADPGGFTKDPDALYLRGPSGFGLRNAADPQLDQGGPDGLGPYSRIGYDKGRALVRVRYAPSDFQLFANPVGGLRRPGKARSYLIIEVVGRAGQIRANDPTTQLNKAVKIANYAGDAEYRASLGEMKLYDNRNVSSKRLTAMASIGIIESSRFITNKYKVSRPAELGAPSESGLRYENNPVDVITRWGGNLTAGNQTLEGTGSLYSNADLLLHGRHDVLLNRDLLGDGWLVAGDIRGADDLATLQLQVQGDPGSPYILSNNSANELDSRQNNFRTIGGVLRDGLQEVDLLGFARATPYKAPPSILVTDPATGLNRFLAMTRDSGPLDPSTGRNTGRFGYGRGIYVDSNERANAPTEDVREASEVARALPNDWLNPSNANSVGWQGPYYIPLATYVRLRPDGFEIIRDGRSRQRYWRTPSGVSTTTSRVRYRVREIGGQVYILNSIVNSAIIDLANLGDQSFLTEGQPFNGALFFEGDIRIRGVIPTDVQISVITMGTAYVEGSITKGLVQENGAVLDRPSRSMLMLMAKDYVALNTTMFFGPQPGQDPKPKNADVLPDTPNPIELDLSEATSIGLQTQFLLDPSGNPLNPTLWRPYANQYAPFGGGPNWNASLVMTHAADDGGPTFIGVSSYPATFADPTPGLPTAYAFSRLFDFGPAGTVDYNAAALVFAPGGNIPVYGLGNPSLNAYPKFETVTFPLIRPTWNYANRKLNAPGGNPEGAIEAAVQDETLFTVQLTAAGTFSPKNYALARFAVTPHDVRIEAALFAEEGSFFVIPGPSFNYNPDDTRAAFDARVNQLGSLPLAQRDRFERYGVMPEVPFYGEPLDVRVQIVGSISENMPPPIAQQSSWQRQWGWIPRLVGGTGRFIPAQHVPTGYNLNNNRFVPNLIVSYDPALATAATEGPGGTWTPIRRNADGWVLPPMPMLPISPTLMYFGENNP
ncbi:MAG TPA: hypothetical protein PLH94_10970 [Fimbriimonadaceae bacterium]|nr:hypothetical protein [Fimbriimonadaceae bacterium]